MFSTLCSQDEEPHIGKGGVIWTGFLAISKSPELIDPSIPSSAVYYQGCGGQALPKFLLERNPAPHFLHWVPGPPGEPQILLGLLTSWKIMRRTPTCQLARELTAKRKEAYSFTLFLQETKGPVPWPQRSVVLCAVLHSPRPRLCEVGPAQVQTREAEVREMSPFVLGTCVGLSSLGGREGWGSSLVGSRNGKRSPREPWPPSCWVIHLGSG